MRRTTGGAAIGYFLATVCIVVTLYWVYRGLRLGLYPSLNMFLVFFLALLVTLNYYDLMMPLIGRIAPTSSLTVRQCISFIATYFIVFVFFLYFCLWLCSETMRLHTAIDIIGGGIMGFSTGVVCCGVLLMMWFSLPFAEREYPVDDREMFFPCHRLTLQAVTFVGERIPGSRSFRGLAYLRDLRYGLPSIPSIGEGFYVSSIPTGLRVFIGAGAKDPVGFINQVKERLARPEREIRPSERRRDFGEQGRTPILIQRPAEEAMVAVIMDEIPRRIEGLKALEMYVPDGEVGVSKPELSPGNPIFIRVYHLKRESNIASVIALFEPNDDELRARMEDYLPTRNCFFFDDDEMVARLMEKGATHEEAQRILHQLHRGGKATFRGRTHDAGPWGDLWVVEVTGSNKWRIFAPAAPEDLDEAKKKRRGRRR